MFLFGQWGTVCDSSWDLADATVVCHQLGYMRAVEAPKYSRFGGGTGLSWYSNVECVGTEMDLTECSKSTSPFGRACSHSYVAGVVCSSESETYLFIRLLVADDKANVAAMHTVQVYITHN